MQPWQYKRGTANLNMGLRGMKLNCYTSGPVSWALASGFVMGDHGQLLVDAREILKNTSLI